MKRIYFLDGVKGLGIILVIIGHMQKNNFYFKEIIYSFHMPLFFILSGFLIKCKESNEKIKPMNIMVYQRIKGIIIPYFILSFIYLFIEMLLFDFTIRAFIIGGIFIISFVGIGALWFLPCLFVSEVLFEFLKRRFSDAKCITLICILSCISLILGSLEINVLVVTILRVFISMLFIAFGYYFLGRIIKLKINIYLFLLILAIDIILINLNGLVDMHLLIFRNQFMYLITSIIGSTLIISIFKNLNIKLLNYLGKNTLIILATHQHIITFVSRYIDNGIIILSIVILSEYLIIVTTNKYFPWMVGKFKKKEKSKLGLA